MAGRRDIDRLQHEIQELFADLWQVPRISGLRQGFRPAVDCFLTQEPPQLHVVFDLAGVDPSALTLVVSERTLVLSGERRRPSGDRRVVYQQMELEHGPFERRVQLQEDVDPTAAKARYQRGLLEVTIPVVQQPLPPPRRLVIEVRTRR